MLSRLEAFGGLNKPQDGMQGRIRVRSYDTSIYKCAADQWMLANGVNLLFHARASNVLMEGSRITALVIETKSGRQAIRANTFIDCSGDADVAAFAGVPYEVGDGHWSGLFPSTMFRVGHVGPCRRLRLLVSSRQSTTSWNARKARILVATNFHAEVRSCGRRSIPPSGAPT